MTHSEDLWTLPAWPGHVLMTLCRSSSGWDRDKPLPVRRAGPARPLQPLTGAETEPSRSASKWTVLLPGVDEQRGIGPYVHAARDGAARIMRR